MADCIWRLIPGQALARRGWDDEYVLYNDLSGDTHLLGIAAIHMLDALKAAPAGTAQLAQILGATFDVDAADDLHQQVADLLASLRALHLVEPAC